MLTFLIQKQIVVKIQQSNVPEQKQEFEQETKKQEKVIENERKMTTYNL